MPDEDLESRVVGDVSEAYDAILAANPDPAGDPAPEATEATAPPVDGPLPDDIPDDIPYRDAKKLRDDLARYKERYRPYEERLGNIPDDVRQQLLDEVDDLAGSLYGLPAEDRHALMAFADVVRSGDADQIRQVLDAWRGGFDDPAPQPAAKPEFDPADGELVTRADLERFYAEQSERQAVEAAQYEIIREVRDLGYDPEAADPIERARTGTLLTLAGEFGGDIAKAHEMLEAERQRQIDEYLAAKTKDASRTAAAPVGGSPSPARNVLDLSDDERRDAAMQMLEQHLG